MKPEIIAHRGASGEAPENTLVAFRLAWEREADGVEMDLRLSKDGRVVVFHDKTLRRVAGVRGNVGDKTWMELSELDAGSWKNPRWRGEKIPSLEQALELIPAGKTAWLELKEGPEIVNGLDEAFRNNSAVRPRLRLIAFSLPSIEFAKTRFPDIPCYWIVDLSGVRARELNNYIGKCSKQARAVGLDGLDFGVKTPLTEEQVALVHGAGLGLCVWTVDDPELARALAEAGVETITTNWPDRVRRWLGR